MGCLHPHGCLGLLLHPNNLWGLQGWVSPSLLSLWYSTGCF